MRRETWSVVAMAAFAVLAIPGQMLLGAVSEPSRVAPPGLDAPTVRRVYAALPLAFEANRGQAGPDAGFVARGSGYAFLVGAQGATLGFTPGARRGRSGPPPAGTAPALEVMRIELIGADAHAPVRLGAPAGTTGSFVGSDTTHWRTAVPDYSRIEYRGVYPGIDLLYHGLQGSLEYDFVVAPGADPQQIRLRVDGAPSSLGATGEVALALPGGTAVQHPPTSFQLPPARPHPAATTRPARPMPAAPRRPGASPPPPPPPVPAPVPVSSGYVPGAGGELHLGLGAYDRSRPLIVDPVVTWSPAIGGGLDDSFVSTVDRAGAAYVVTGTPSPAAAGGGPVSTDVAVLKLDRAGRVVYRTFLGGDGIGGPSEVAVDGTGALQISGAALPETGSALLADGSGRRFTMRVGPRGLPLPQTGAAAG
jgi:hypothetical protein